MVFNPHKLGMHKVLKHIPLNAIFDAPYKRMLKKAVNIADLRRIAKARSHKVSVSNKEKMSKLEIGFAFIGMLWRLKVDEETNNSLCPRKARVRPNTTY